MGALSVTDHNKGEPFFAMELWIGGKQLKANNFPTHLTVKHNLLFLSFFSILNFPIITWQEVNDLMKIFDRNWKKRQPPQFLSTYVCPPNKAKCIIAEGEKGLIIKLR